MSTPAEKFQYQVGGSLEKQALCYVTRQADEDFYQALKAGEFCYVLNSRQMGKSSLRVRVMQRLQAEGVACAVIDITSIGSQGITVAEWYLGIIRRLVRGFRVPVDALAWWNGREGLSPVQRLSEFLEEELLVAVAQPIVIFIDEIDSILKLEFKDDFFALIRACYNQRAERSDYQRLTFALLGVATPSDLIQDKNRTPFNIGRAIAVQGFQRQEAQPLLPGLAGKAEQPEAVLQAILDWTGGQPFLTQKLCQLVAKLPLPIAPGEEAAAIAQCVQSSILEHWEAQDDPEHLKTIRDRVLSNAQQQGQVLGLYQTVLQQGTITADTSTEQMQLRLSGLVVERQGQITVFNRIYATVFNQTWTEAMLAQLRPYAAAFMAWEASNCQDESRLLRGQALQEAEAWAKDKNLDPQDYRFFAASRELDMRVAEQSKRILEDANLTLIWANRKAARRLKVSGLLLGVAVPVAMISGWQSWTVQTELKRREAEFQDIWTFSRGQSALYQGKPEEARKIFDQILERNPQNSFVRISLGNLYFDQKAYEKAVNEFQSVVKIDPKNAFAWGWLGYVLSEQKKLDEAIAAYRQAIALDPKDAPAYNNLGTALSYQNQLDAAITAYRQAIALDPKDAKAYNNLGLALSDQNQLDAAITAYRQAIALDPKDTTAYTNLGIALSDQNQLDAAIAAYRQAIALDPKDAQAYNGLGNALRKQNQLDAAIAAYRQAIALDPKSTYAYNGLGNALRDQKQLDAAIAAYRQAIALDPKYAPAYNNLGLALLDRKNFSEAISNFEKASTLDKQLIDPVTSIGLVKYETGEVDEAVRRWRIAISINEKVAEPQLATAVALYIKGEVESALTMGEAALRLDSSFGNLNILKKNHWGEKLRADAAKFLALPKIQALLTQLKAAPESQPPK